MNSHRAIIAYLSDNLDSFRIRINAHKQHTKALRAEVGDDHSWYTRYRRLKASPFKVALFYGSSKFCFSLVFLRSC